MLYTAQWPPSTSNNLHFDFLEPNNNLNNDSSSSSTGSGSGSVKNRGQDLDCVMTGASISVVTSSNAATLPYTAGDTAGGVGVGVGVGGGVDDISPTGIKMAQQEGMALGEDCNGGMGMGMGCDSGSPAPPQSLTLRLIMQGKEVGSIIGKVNIFCFSLFILISGSCSLFETLETLKTLVFKEQLDLRKWLLSSVQFYRQVFYTKPKKIFEIIWAKVKKSRNLGQEKI